MDEKKVMDAIETISKRIVDLKIMEAETNGVLSASVSSYNTAIEAMEKQLPKKVEVWNGQASCPKCNKLYGNMADIKMIKSVTCEFEHCKYCGQRLDWSED